LQVGPLAAIVGSHHKSRVAIVVSTPAITFKRNAQTGLIVSLWNRDHAMEPFFVQRY